MDKSGQADAAGQGATLPSIVSIAAPGFGHQLLQAKFFTRLETSVTSPAALTKALGASCGAFCHQHHKIVLIYSDDQDTHHDHFRDVCLLLKDGDVDIQYGGCIFDAESALEAGFQMDKLKDGAVMVVDLQQNDDEDDEDDEDEDDDDDNEDEGEDHGEQAENIDTVSR